MKLNNFQLAAALREAADAVEQSDSFQGMITWDALHDSVMHEPYHFEVRGTWRVGNSQGQGGFKMIPSAEEVAKIEAQKMAASQAEEAPTTPEDAEAPAPAADGGCGNDCGSCSCSGEQVDPE